MKINSTSANSIIKNIKQNNPYIVLLHGNELGVITDTTNSLVKNFLKEKYNKEQVITVPEVKNNIFQFIHLANSQNLLAPEEKVIILKESPDKLLEAIDAYLQNPNPSVLIIIEGGSLSTKSKVRNFAERHKKIISIGCYQDNETSIKKLITQTIIEQQFTINNESINWIASHSGSNRLITKSNLEKLLLYKYNEKKININDVQKVIEDSSNNSIDIIVIDTLNKNKTEALIKFNNVKNMIKPIILIRSFINQITNLIKIKSNIKNGLSTEEAIKNIRPPIFFTYIAPIKHQINLWQLKDLEKLLIHLIELDIECKKNDNISHSLLQNFILEVSS